MLKSRLYHHSIRIFFIVIWKLSNGERLSICGLSLKSDIPDDLITSFFSFLNPTFSRIIGLFIIAYHGLMLIYSFFLCIFLQVLHFGLRGSYYNFKGHFQATVCDILSFENYSSSQGRKLYPYIHGVCIIEMDAHVLGVHLPAWDSTN